MPCLNPSENGKKFRNSSQNYINYEIKFFYDEVCATFFVFFGEKASVPSKNDTPVERKEKKKHQIHELCICKSNQISLTPNENT